MHDLQANERYGCREKLLTLELRTIVATYLALHFAAACNQQQPLPCEDVLAGGSSKQEQRASKHNGSPRTAHKL